MAVEAAVYGYASVVTSRPRSRAPRMSWRRNGVSRWPMLVTWTTWREAPVVAASAITSCSAATPPPVAGSRPPWRRCTKQDTPWCAATRNRRRISSRLAPGVYSMPNPTASAPSASPRSTRESSRGRAASGSARGGQLPVASRPAGAPPALAQVYEAGSAVVRRDPEQAQDLLAARTGRVLDAEPDGERAVGEPAFHQGIESG